MIQAKFGLNWSSGFRGEDFLKSLQTDDGRFVVKKDIFLFVDGLLKEDVIMLNLYPDLKQEEMEDSKREFIFVIDRSGKLYLLLTDLIFSILNL
jgi:hypothetical protein